jgi:hypothetical protein
MLLPLAINLLGSRTRPDPPILSAHDGILYEAWHDLEDEFKLCSYFKDFSLLEVTDAILLHPIPLNRSNTGPSLRSTYLKKTEAFAPRM